MMRTVDRFYQLILSIIIVYVFFLNLPLFLNEKVSGIIAPTIYIGFLVVAIPYALLNIENLLRFLKSSFFIWLVLISLIYALNIWRIDYFGIQVSDEEYIDNVNALERHALVLVLAYCIFCINKDLLRKAFVPVIVLIPFLVVWDLISPEDFLGLTSKVGGGETRASATFLNPNLAAESIVCSLLVFYNQLSKRLLGILILIAGVGVLATFSRSGLGGLIIVAAYFLFTGRISWYFSLVPILFVLFFGLISRYIEDLLLITTGGNETRVEELLDRMSFFGRVGSEGIDGVEDNSSEGRLDLFVQAWDGIVDKPFFGHAVTPRELLDGASHNLALEHWFTSGLLGLFSVVLLGLLIYRGTKKVSFLGIGPFVLYYSWSIWFNHQHFTVLPWLISFMIVLFMNVDTANNGGYPGTKSVRKKSRKKRRKHRSNWKSSSEVRA